MIVFDLECRVGGHKFEGWFSSSDDYARQQDRGLVTCPACGSSDVVKALMAPNLARKGNQLSDNARKLASAPEPEATAVAPVMSAPLPPQVVEIMHKLAKIQTEALKSSRFVGDSFAEDARAMHYGEREAETIHGQTTLAEAQELLEEGIAVAPLPFPIVPPEQAN